MISEEEAEKIKRKLAEELENTIKANQCGLSTNDFSEDIKTLETALEYIQQLEAKQQNLMKFLIECKKEYTEELKYNFTKRDARLQLQLVDMTLEIMKGEG